MNKVSNPEMKKHITNLKQLLSYVGKVSSSESAVDFYKSRAFQEIKNLTNMGMSRKDLRALHPRVAGLIKGMGYLNPAKYTKITDKAGTKWGVMPFGGEGIVLGREDHKSIKYVTSHHPGMKTVTIQNPRRKRRKSKTNLVPILVIVGSVALIYWLSKKQ